MNLSIWEKQSFINYDFIIIGSGFVGLHTALALRKKFANKKIAILERGILPTGASSKNAGFACMGSATEILDNLQNMPEAEVVNLFAKRLQGLAITTKMFANQDIGYAQNGSYELLQKAQSNTLDKLDFLNKTLAPATQNKTVFAENKNIISQNNFNKNTYTHAIANLLEGEINSGKLLKALIQLAHQNDIDIYTGCPVTNIIENGKDVDVICKNSTQSSTQIFKAQYLFYCTNAFAKTLLPTVDLVPGRGQVLITKPIANLAIKGIYHLQEGYFYFREINNCILFGGGRNLDFTTEQTTTMAPNPKILDALTNMLTHDILPNTPFEIDYTWQGIMAFGPSKKPIVTSFSPRTFGALRCGGMGVALAPLLGQNLVDTFTELL